MTVLKGQDVPPGFKYLCGLHSFPTYNKGVYLKSVVIHITQLRIMPES